jgi:transposase
MSMWIAENRKHYDRRGLRYPSDQTDAEWALAKLFIAIGKFAAPKWEARLRCVLEAVLYVLITGCQFAASYE